MAERLWVAGCHRWTGVHHTCAQKPLLALVTGDPDGKGAVLPCEEKGAPGDPQQGK